MHHAKSETARIHARGQPASARAWPQPPAGMQRAEIAEIQQCSTQKKGDTSLLATQGCKTHKMVNASKHKIVVRGGVEVYGMWFDPGYGYHVDSTTGVAKGNDPESIYAVMSGKCVSPGHLDRAIARVQPWTHTEARTNTFFPCPAYKP